MYHECPSTLQSLTLTFYEWLPRSGRAQQRQLLTRRVPTVFWRVVEAAVAVVAAAVAAAAVAAAQPDEAAAAAGVDFSWIFA